MLRDLISVSRPTQWLKNGIILAALVFAGELQNPGQLKMSLLAIAIFCLLSSAVYTFNDLFDRERDRQHPLKKKPPARLRTNVGYDRHRLWYSAGRSRVGWRLDYQP